jgi:hypothetical protein
MFVTHLWYCRKIWHRKRRKVIAPKVARSRRGAKQSCACHHPLPGFLFGIVFGPENVGIVFLRKAVNFYRTTRRHVPEYSTLWTKFGNVCGEYLLIVSKNRSDLPKKRHWTKNVFHFSVQRVFQTCFIGIFSEIRTYTNVGLQVKGLLFLSNTNQKWNMSTHFIKTPQC